MVLCVSLWTNLSVNFCLIQWLAQRLLRGSLNAFYCSDYYYLTKVYFSIHNTLLAMKAIDGFWAHCRWHLCIFPCWFSVEFNDSHNDSRLRTKTFKTSCKIPAHDIHERDAEVWPISTNVSKSKSHVLSCEMSKWDKQQRFYENWLSPRFNAGAKRDISGRCVERGRM